MVSRAHARAAVVSVGLLIDYCLVIRNLGDRPGNSDTEHRSDCFADVTRILPGMRKAIKSQNNTHCYLFTRTTIVIILGEILKITIYKKDKKQLESPHSRTHRPL